MKRLVLMVSLLAALAMTGCAAGKDEASADCDARAVEARLSGVDRARHKNLCMLSHGYKRNTLCDVGFANLEAKICYSPKWYFWEKSAFLVE